MAEGWRDEPSPRSPDVEFLDVGEVAGEDELLPEPESGTGLRARRAVWLLAAVVLAALVVTALVNRPASAPRAATTPRGRLAVVAPVPDVGQQADGDRLVPVGNGGYVEVHDGIAIGPISAPPARRPPLLDLPGRSELTNFVVHRDPCPNRLGCSIGTTPTPPVLAALRAALPGPRDIGAASVSTNAQLSLRAVRARIGSEMIEIVIRPADRGDAARIGTLRSRSGPVGYARVEEFGFTVDVQGHGRAVALDQLAILAADQRLLR